MTRDIREETMATLCGEEELRGRRMKMRWVSCIVLASITFGMQSARAELYKCKSPTGAVTYSDHPCPAGSTNESPPPINSTPKSLGVACYRDKDRAACDKLSAAAESQPELLAQARRDAKYAEDRDKCLAGDRTACIQSICQAAFSDKATVESILTCAREQRLPTGSSWAAVLPWKDEGAGVRSTQGYCLTPRTDTWRGETRTMFAIISLRDYSHAEGEHHPMGFSVSNSWGKSLDEAAQKICSPKRK
jgi:hypothetical protein